MIHTERNQDDILSWLTDISITYDIDTDACTINHMQLGDLELSRDQAIEAFGAYAISLCEQSVLDRSDEIIQDMVEWELMRYGND